MNAEDIEDFFYYEANFQLYGRNAPELSCWDDANQHESAERREFLNWISDRFAWIYFLPEEYPPKIEWAMAKGSPKKFPLPWEKFEFFMVGICDTGRVLLETEPGAWLATSNFNYNQNGLLDFYENFEKMYKDNLIQYALNEAAHYPRRNDTWF